MGLGLDFLMDLIGSSLLFCFLSTIMGTQFAPLCSHNKALQTFYAFISHFWIKTHTPQLLLLIPILMMGPVQWALLGPRGPGSITSENYFQCLTNTRLSLEEIKFYSKKRHHSSCQQIKSKGHKEKGQRKRKEIKEKEIFLSFLVSLLT